jgi:phosphatidylglycerol---prolipoprotein diacylglyceryl transferase
MGSISLLAYIPININPVIVTLGPLALRWYGLMYVLGILFGLWAIGGYTRRKGLHSNTVYRLLWWCIVAGLLGGRLYYVVQQPNFVSFYLAQPQHILATWEGGMAFFGAIFLVLPTIFWRSKMERINPLVAIDAGVLLAAAGQIFGRIGNLINGDIVGYRSTLPWATIYQNPQSIFCLNLANPSQCGSVATAVQPAAVYELLANIVVLGVMFFLARRLRRPGVLMLVYLFSYVTTQFSLFFVRDNLVVSFLGLNWGLKQAQWTSLVVFMCLIPLTFLVLRFSKPIPQGEVEATYGIAQKSQKSPQGDRVEGEERRDEPRADVDERPTLDTVGRADRTVQEAEGTGRRSEN